MHEQINLCHPISLHMTAMVWSDKRVHLVRLWNQESHSVSGVPVMMSIRYCTGNVDVSHVVSDGKWNILVAWLAAMSANQDGKLWNQPVVFLLWNGFWPIWECQYNSLSFFFFKGDDRFKKFKALANYHNILNDLQLTKSNWAPLSFPIMLQIYWHSSKPFSCQQCARKSSIAHWMFILIEAKQGDAKWSEQTITEVGGAIPDPLEQESQSLLIFPFTSLRWLQLHTRDKINTLDHFFNKCV